jgi:hypothetical protein
MKICDLDEKFEELIKDGSVKVEIIGEDKIWIAMLFSREWSNELQDYVYNEVGGCTGTSFLAMYDVMAELASSSRTCSLGFDYIT